MFSVRGVVRGVQRGIHVGLCLCLQLKPPHVGLAELGQQQDRPVTFAY